MQQLAGLISKSVKGAALPLEGVDDVHGSDGLPLGMLSVSDSIPDDILKESGDFSLQGKNRFSRRSQITARVQSILLPID